LLLLLLLLQAFMSQALMLLPADLLPDLLAIFWQTLLTWCGWLLLLLLQILLSQVVMLLNLLPDVIWCGRLLLLVLLQVILMSAVCCVLFCYCYCCCCCCCCCCACARGRQ
jgi:hypothetical protein